jgi:signal peptidase II
VAADQLSKMWVRSYPEGHVIYGIGFFHLRPVYNTGAAFGLFQGQSFALIIVDILGVIIFLFLALFMPRRLPLLATIPNRIALGFIIGGTIGNLIDRLRFGHVTDFVDFPVWAAFNVADSCIVIGVIIFVYSLLRLVITEKQ